MLKRLLLAGGLALALAAPAFADAVKQGGTLTITYKDDFSTLDPAIGYDWANWSPIDVSWKCPASPVATSY